METRRFVGVWASRFAVVAGVLVVGCGSPPVEVDAKTEAATETAALAGGPSLGANPTPYWMVREGMARRRPSEDLRMAASKRYRAADYEGAAALAREAIHLRAQLDGFDPLKARTTARVVLGASLVELGRYEEAVPWLEAARKETAMNGLLENLAIAYARTGRVAEARTLAEPWGRAMLASVGLPPSALPDPHKASGVEAVALLARGGDRASMNRAAGDKDVLDAERLAPESDLCRFLAGWTCLNQKDYAGAEARWQGLLGQGNERFRRQIESDYRRAAMARRIVDKRRLRAQT